MKQSEKLVQDGVRLKLATSSDSCSEKNVHDDTGSLADLLSSIVALTHMGLTSADGTKENRN